MVRPDPRPGQEGNVWEWTVTPTAEGPQAYTFYVDSTVPCATLSFTVGNALATATPKPTKTPKPTRTPTDTPTPTATSTQVPNASTSQVTPSKRTLLGNNTDTLTVTATLLDDGGHPVTGVYVKLTAKGGVAGDAVNTNQFAFFTDADGSVQAQLTACFAGSGTDSNAAVSARYQDQDGQTQVIGGQPQRFSVRAAQHATC
jgi:hypothetical protein